MGARRRKVRRARRALPVSASVPVIVIAGLPQSICGETAKIAQERIFAGTQVFAQPSPEGEGRVYSKELGENLLREVTDFAVRRRKESGATLRPEWLAVLYVPSYDQQNLLEQFEFSAHPVALTELHARNENGVSLRHFRDAALDSLKMRFGNGSAARVALDRVRERVNTLSDRERLLLAPRNFHVTDVERLEALFREAFYGQRSWDEVADVVSIGEFTSREIPRLPAGRTRRAFKDARDLVHLAAHPKAFHGVPRELDAADDLRARKLLLQSMFRFGAALPGGFHHDAQLEYEQAVDDLVFDCPVRGEFSAKGQYANIYPDDFVRIGKRE